MLKGEADVPGAGLKRQHVRRGGCFEVQQVPLFVNELQVVNEGGAAQVTFDARFHFDKPLCQFDVQSGLIEMFVNQQARTPVAEWYARYIDLVAQERQQRCVQLSFDCASQHSAHEVAL
jgi:hypothetical protein